MEKPRHDESSESIKLYSERVSSTDYLDEQLDRIQEIAEGKGVIELTDAEKSQILEYESGLADRLLPIKMMKAGRFLFYIDYFKTDEGRSVLSKVCGVEDIPEEDKPLRKFLYEHSPNFQSLSVKERSQITGNSRTHATETLLSALEESLDDAGNIEPSEVPVSENMTLVLDPENLLNKIQLLKTMKEELKQEWQRSIKEGTSPSKARAVLIEIYLARINDFLIEAGRLKIHIGEKAQMVGPDGLAEEEKALLTKKLKYQARRSEKGLPEYSVLSGQDKRDSDASRYDKIEYGADSDYTEGQRLQIGSKLSDYADELLEQWVESSLNRRSDLMALGFDPEKLDNPSFSPKEQKEIAEDHLNSLGLLSNEPNYDHRKTGTASDGKYQVYIEPGNTTAAVWFQKRVLALPDSNRSIVNVLTSQNSHEFGHIFQDLNAEKLPLKIFDKIMIGRRAPFTEGGAIIAQENAAQRLFGRLGADMPHYLLALKSRLSGGNYIDAVTTYYQGRIKPSQILYERGELTKEEFNNLARTFLEKAINSARRIFSDSSYESRSSHLTSTKSASYAEQAILVKKLRDRGMESLLFVRGVNLETLLRLAKIGLLNINDIKRPSLEFVEEYWENNKHKYQLD